MTTRLLLLLLASLSPVYCLSDDLHWPQFRGVNSSGVATDADPPIEFGPTKNVRWKVPVGEGHSSPCVAGDRLFLTTADVDAKTLSVVCFDRHSGKQIWKQSVTADAIEKGHPSFNVASSSPATDGERVVAYFGSYGLIAYSVDGDKLWERRLPLTKSFGGNATSPAIIAGRVVLYRGNYVDHFLAAYDIQTGEEVWNVPQDEEVTGEMACTACPIAIDDTVIVHTARSVQAYDIEDGRLVWIAKAATTATSTPIVVGEEVLIAAWNKMGEPSLRPELPTFDTLINKHDADSDGTISRDELPTLWIFHRPDGIEAPMNGASVRFKWADKDDSGEIDAAEWSRQLDDLTKFRDGYENHGLIAVPLKSTGAIGKDAVRVLLTDGIPEVPSPVSDGDRVYLIKNGGVLTVVDLATGERTARIRTKGRGTHYASPIIAGGRLYTTAGDGTISVLQPADKPEILSTNRVGEPVYATPVPIGDILYVRTHTHLYAFAKAP